MLRLTLICALTIMPLVSKAISAKDIVIPSEGFIAQTYKDPLGRPAVGYGFDLKTVETVEILVASGFVTYAQIEYDLLHLDSPEFQPRVILSRAESLQVLETILGRKGAEVERHLRARDIDPNLSEGKIAALKSMVYNGSTSIIGPKLLRALRTKNMEGAVWEILLNSNSNLDPKTGKRIALAGIDVRRVREAVVFAGRASIESFVKKHKDTAPYIEFITRISNSGAKKQIQKAGLWNLIAGGV